MSEWTNQTCSLRNQMLDNTLTVNLNGNLSTSSITIILEKKGGLGGGGSGCEQTRLINMSQVCAIVLTCKLFESTEAFGQLLVQKEV